MHQLDKKVCLTTQKALVVINTDAKNPEKVFMNNFMTEVDQIFKTRYYTQC